MTPIKDAPGHLLPFEPRLEAAESPNESKKKSAETDGNPGKKTKRRKENSFIYHPGTDSSYLWIGLREYTAPVDTVAAAEYLDSTIMRSRSA